MKKNYGQFNARPVVVTRNGARTSHAVPLAGRPLVRSAEVRLPCCDTLARFRARRQAEAGWSQVMHD